MARRTDKVMPSAQMTVGTAWEKQGIYEESATQNHEIGQRLALDDGRTFFYTLNSATALKRPGTVVCADCDRVEHEDTLTVASPVGSKEVTFTEAATAIIARSQFRNGYLVVNDALGQGQILTIDDNDTIGISETGTIYLREELAVALDVTSDVTIHENLFYKPTLCADLEEFVLGVAPIAVSASYYFWLQTHGWCAVQPPNAKGTEDDERIMHAPSSGITFVTTAKSIYAATGGKQICGDLIFNSDDYTGGVGSLVYLAIWP